MAVYNVLRKRAQEARKMTEQEIRDALLALIHHGERIENTVLESATAHSYADSGVMTYNEGIVIQTDDGSEFQITIVRSR
jgi:hypothetical protein